MGFRAELASLLNRYSMENISCTPDYILAEYMASCLEAFEQALVARQRWYGQPMGTPANPREDDPLPDIEDVRGILKPPEASV
jgi:hypothetical protein